MDAMPGESGKAGQILNDAYPDNAAEQVLVQSKTLDASDPQFKAAVADVTQRLEKTDSVGKIDPALISKDGHSALVAFELPGKAEVTEKSVVNSLAAVDDVHVAPARFSWSRSPWSAHSRRCRRSCRSWATA